MNKLNQIHYLVFSSIMLHYVALCCHKFINTQSEIRALQQLSAACASYLVYVTMFTLCVILMDFMQPSPTWSVIHCPASQQITCILRSPHVHHGLQNIPPLVSFRIQINLIHAQSFHFLDINFNIIFPIRPLPR